MIRVNLSTFPTLPWRPGSPGTSNVGVPGRIYKRCLGEESGMNQHDEPFTVVPTGDTILT